MRRTAAAVSQVIVIATLAACTTQVRTTPLVGTLPSGRYTDTVAVIEDTSGIPEYEEIARVSVHVEATFFVRPSEREARERLLEEARKLGAEAIIDVSTRRSTVVENQVLHVEGTAIRFRRAPAGE